MKKKKYIYFLVPFISLFFLSFFVSESFAIVPERPSPPSFVTEGEKFVMWYGGTPTAYNNKAWLLACFGDSCEFGDNYTSCISATTYGDGYPQIFLESVNNQRSGCSLGNRFFSWNGSQWSSSFAYEEYTWSFLTDEPIDYTSFYASFPITLVYDGNTFDFSTNYNNLGSLTNGFEFDISEPPPPEMCPYSGLEDLELSDPLCVEPLTVTELSVLQDINDNLVTIKAFCYALGVALALGLVLLVINKLVSYTIGQAF